MKSEVRYVSMYAAPNVARPASVGYSELGACSPVGGRHFYIPGANSKPPHSDQTIKAGGPRPPGAMAGSVRVKHYVFGMLRRCLFV